MSEKAFFDREVTAEQAREAAQRLIDVAFHKEGARARFCIPTQASDDDVTLIDYITQTSAKLDALKVPS